MVNSRILGFLWRGRAYCVLNENYFPTLRVATAIEERVVGRGRPIFDAKLKAWRHRMFKLSPLLIGLCLCRIINHFACWIMNAFSGKKRYTNSMAFWHQADWHTNLPPFQGARPHHVVGSYEVLFAQGRHEDFTNDTWLALLQSENVFKLGGIIR